MPYIYPVLVLLVTFLLLLVTSTMCIDKKDHKEDTSCSGTYCLLVHGQQAAHQYRHLHSRAQSPTDQFDGNSPTYLREASPAEHPELFCSFKEWIEKKLSITANFCFACDEIMRTYISIRLRMVLSSLISKGLSNSNMTSVLSGFISHWTTADGFVLEMIKGKGIFSSSGRGL